MTVTLLEWNGGGGTQNQIRLLTKQAWHGGSYSSIRVSTEFKDILSALLTFLLLPGHHFVRCNCTTTQVNPLRYISNGLIHWWHLNSNVGRKKKQIWDLQCEWSLSHIFCTDDCEKLFAHSEWRSRFTLHVDASLACILKHETLHLTMHSIVNWFRDCKRMTWGLFCSSDISGEGLCFWLCRQGRQPNIGQPNRPYPSPYLTTDQYKAAFPNNSRQN